MTHPSRGFDFSRGVKASGLWETRKGGGVSQLGTGRDWGRLGEGIYPRGGGGGSGPTRAPGAAGSGRGGGGGRGTSQPSPSSPPRWGPPARSHLGGTQGCHLGGGMMGGIVGVGGSGGERHGDRDVTWGGHGGSTGGGSGLGTWGGTRLGTALRIEWQGWGQG